MFINWKWYAWKNHWNRKKNWRSYRKSGGYIFIFILVNLRCYCCYVDIVIIVIHWHVFWDGNNSKKKYHHFSEQVNKYNKIIFIHHFQWTHSSVFSTFFTQEHTHTDTKQTVTIIHKSINSQNGLNDFDIIFPFSILFSLFICLFHSVLCI